MSKIVMISFLFFLYYRYAHIHAHTHSPIHTLLHQSAFLFLLLILSLFSSSTLSVAANKSRVPFSHLFQSCVKLLHLHSGTRTRQRTRTELVARIVKNNSTSIPKITHTPTQRQYTQLDIQVRAINETSSAQTKLFIPSSHDKREVSFCITQYNSCFVFG